MPRGGHNRKPNNNLTQQERDALVLDYMDQVKIIVDANFLSYVKRNIYQKDDLIQIALLGVIRASQLFEPSRGFKFKTLAERKAKFAVLDYIKRDKTCLNS